MNWRHLLIINGCILSICSVEANEWRQFRGPNGQGKSESKGLPITWSATENLAWKQPLPGPGGSSPVVFNDRIYVTCYTGYAEPGKTSGDINALKRHLLCLNRTTGELIWSTEIPAVQPEQEKVRDHGYASSTPATDADRVYVFYGKSGVFAFNHDGKQLWHADVGSKVHGWGSATSPLLYKDLVIINASVESESLIALDKQSGKEVWRSGGIKDSWNTPILVSIEGQQDELVFAIMGKVLGLRPNTGEQLWSCATGIGWYMVPSAVNDKATVFCIGGRTGGSLAVRAGSRGDIAPSRLWTLAKGSNVSSPVFHNGHLYWLHENTGVAYCVEAATGQVVYEERLAAAGQFYASPVLADGKLFCVSRRGATFVLAAKPEFEQLARNDLGDRSSFDASPIIDGKRLLIRSDRFLYCVETK